ncbi:signal peptide peptidase SppA [Halocola ammonii]
MKEFFRNLLASILGSGIAFIVVGFILIFAFVGIFTASITSAFEDMEFGQTKTVQVKDQSVLNVELNGPVVERMSNDGFNFNFNTFEPLEVMGLNEILNSFEKAKNDDKIEGVFLDLTTVSVRASSLLDIRDAILDFKDSGKWVVAYAENYSQATYYLASAADEVYIYPEGSLDWRGLNAEIAFFKNMLDRLDIEVQVFRGEGNKFKSAVEPFIMEKMSEANKEQTRAFLSDMWAIYTEDISRERGISVERLNELADSLSIRSAADAAEYGLVDKTMYRDEVLDHLREKMGIEDEDEGIAKVDLYDYRDKKKKRKKKDDEGDKGRVAVVYAVGEIRSGQGGDGVMGSERVAKALRDARKDEDVKAIVLRVNSPGGSALASDVIWRETQLIKEEGKPFVVSMSDLAASGGYYIAAGADQIFANPNTITGSIGVFGLIPNLGQFMENKLGITFDNVKTNEHADLATGTKSLDPLEYEAIQESVNDVYQTFLQRVADGRGMTKEQVDEIAQGRVWSGKQALELGLVDELGNLEAAVEHAAEMAQLDDYEIKELPELEDPFEKFFKSLSGGMKESMTRDAMGDYYEAYMELQRLRNLSTMNGVQARLPFIMEME